jgi:protein involved in polysaccharide export with SLBB domain
MQLKNLGFAISAIALIATGCSSLLAQSKARITLIDIPVHHVHVHGPKDITITWYRADVLTTNSLSAGDKIEVIVRGEVGRLGLISVAQGTTLLEAIKLAGGFTERALARSVLVEDAKHRHSLKLHRQKKFLRRSRVWFGDGTGDFVLEPGTTIYVPRGI